LFQDASGQRREAAAPSLAPLNLPLAQLHQSEISNSFIHSFKV